MFPEGWEQNALIALLDRIIDYRGQSVPKAKTGIPLITARNVRKGYLDFSTAEFIDENHFDSWMTRGKPRKGDILFTTEAPLGNACRFPENGTYAVGQRTVTLRCSDNLDSEFLLYSLLSEKGQQSIDIRSSGSTAKGIKSSELKKVKFIYPKSLPEQQKIAKILQTWDRTIATTEKMIDACKQQKKALMQQLLTGKKRFAGFEGESSSRPGFAQKKLGVLPDDWILKNVADRYWFQEGPGVRKHQFTESGIKLFNGTNIQKSRINLQNTTTHVSEAEGNGPYAHFLADAGDLVIACSGISVDRFDEKIAFITKSHLPLCMNTSTMRFKVKPNETEIADIEYLRYFLMSDLFKNQIRRQITGSAQLNFGPSHVTKCFIPMPTIEEQKKIAQVLNGVDNELDRNEEKLTRLNQEKNALMQQLLTGKRRVKIDD